MTLAAFVFAVVVIAPPLVTDLFYCDGVERHFSPCLAAVFYHYLLVLCLGKVMVNPFSHSGKLMHSDSVSKRSIKYSPLSGVDLRNYFF